MFQRISSNSCPLNFATCSKPPSGDKYRIVTYPRTQKRDQGASWICSRSCNQSRSKKNSFNFSTTNADYSYFNVLTLFTRAVWPTPASWSRGTAFVSETEDLRFKSRGGQIGHSVANGSPLLLHFFERSCIAAGAMTQRPALQSRYALRHIIVSISKDLIWFIWPMHFTRGSKNAPYLTIKPKILGTHNLACELVFTKSV